MSIIENINNIFKIIDQIYKENQIPEWSQGYCDSININKDTKAEYPKCGQGVFLNPNIVTEELYAGKLNINNKIYKCILQFIVNPKYIRISKDYKFWVCDGSINGIRPYRFLLKQIN